MAVAAHADRPAAAGAVVWLATAGHFLNDAYGNVYPTLVPLVAAAMGFGLVSGSLVITGVGVAGSVLQPLFGEIADRYSSALIAPAALAIVAVATGLLGFVHAAFLFVVLAVIAGVANGAFHPPSLSLVRSVSGQRPGRFASIFFTGGTAGRAVGPVLMVACAALMGVHGLTLLVLPGLALAVVLGATAPRRAAARAGGAPHADAAPSAAVPSTLSLVRDRLGPLSVVMAIAITRGVVTTSISTFWPLLHHHTVAALFGSSTVIAVMMLAGSVGNIIGGNISDRVPHHVLLTVTALLAAASLGAFALAQGPWIYPFAALAGAFGMSGFAVTTVMGQNLMPERVATASGLAFGLANAVGSGLVALLAVAAATWGGSTALLLAAGLCLLSVPPTLAYPRVLRRMAGRTQETAMAAAGA